jgi:nitrite reductase (NADH) large subunit
MGRERAMTDQTTPQTWRCTVCGHIHRGPNPPDLCPVCGAPPDDFEPFVDAAPTASPVLPRRWRCTVCGYVHEGGEPPDECPMCGAPRGDFEPLAEQPPTSTSASRLHVLIAGTGAAGLAAAETARRAAPDSRITLLSRETELPYYRLNLTRYLAGEVSRAQLGVHPASWYDEQRVELRTGVEVERLDLGGRRVALGGGEQLGFDRLVLASGAHPFVPPIPGAEQAGVTTLRTVEDADRLLDAVARGVPCVCVGGGLLGLETAAALARRGADVTVLEGFGHLMPAQLDPRAGALLASHLGAVGVTVRTAVHVKDLRGSGRVTAVALEEGDELAAELVVLATGVRPNTFLAIAAGLAVKKGLVVDDRLSTSNPDVFAAGDVAEHQGVLYGSWFVAQHQGAVAGANAAGADIAVGNVPRSHTLKVVGLDTFSIGRFTPADGSDRAIAGKQDGAYASFVFRDDLLVGANLLGRVDLAAAVKRAIESRWDFAVLLARGPSASEVAEHLHELAAAI